MPGSPAISVVIPTFNRQQMLGEAMASVRAQGFEDLEAIVVDDGSSDGTRALVEAVVAADPRFRYHHQPNGGAASARNAGLDLARGDLIAFLDSDDAWQPWHLELMVACLARLPEAGLVWTDMAAVDGGGAVTARRALRSTLSAYRYFSNDQLFASSVPLSELGVEIPAEDRDRRLYQGDVFSPMVMGNLVLPSSVLMRRARLDEVGRFDEHLVTGEDYEFFLRACRAGQVAFADLVDVRYRVGTSDRLSGPAMGLPIARAYLTVLERTLEQDAGRITLPPELITEARGYANRWVGETELLAGSPRAARPHLATAFRLGQQRARMVALLGLSFLPRAALTRISRVRRRMRGRAAA
jgi:GT2 family glycosyltransferase